MNINRNNYEEFFLLYVDNELSASERQAVEAFAAVHPDLKAELDMLSQTILPGGQAEVFMDKEMLFRTSDTGSLVNMTNYESFFVKYADDELNNEEKAATEQFVYRHPECQEDFELIQQTKLHPDTSIRFPDKNLLYRQEETKRRPVLVMWMRFAAAAVLILLAGLFWLQQKQPVQPPTQVPVAVNTNKPEKANNTPVGNNTKQPAIEETRVLAKTASSSPADEPKKILVAAVPKKEIQKAENQPLLVSVEPAVEQKEIKEKVQPALIAANTPEVQVNQPAAIESNIPQNASFASKAASEDYVYVNNSTENRKSPLRGLLRKASRYAEQKNPLSQDHKKGGVFTASQE